MNIPCCPFCEKEYMPQEPIRETVYYAQCDCQQRVPGKNPPEPADSRPDPPPAPPEPKRMCDACKDSGFTDVPDEPGYVQTCLRCDHAALVKRVEALERKVGDLQLCIALKETRATTERADDDRER